MKKKNLLTIACAVFIFIAGAFLFSSCNPDDTTAPVISLSGNNPMEVVLNTSYTEPDATATDDEDGDVTVTITGTVNANLKGTYTITYSATDAAGNQASKTRTVNVVNEAEYLAGTYSVVDEISGGGTDNYNDEISTSSNTNNKIWVTRFANYDNGAVYFEITGTTVTLPSQDVECGTPATATLFLGNGTISGTTITINYTETVPDKSSVSGTETYTKQ
jgi:hypothetical protein